MINGCEECLKKQRVIDKQAEEIQRLRQKLHFEERRTEEGFFGSSTPSSKIPVKANIPEEKERKKRGAKPGHQGHGRKAFTESEAERVERWDGGLGNLCPDCGGMLQDKGDEDRCILESRPMKAERVVYRLPKKYCPHCQKSFRTRPPGVLPKSLFGNQLITNAAVMHYLHGVPMGRVCQQLELDPGSLVKIFHRLAGLFAGVSKKLIAEYRREPVRHADETGWRTDGKNGYVWLFATKKLSIFQFKKTRSSQVPRAVFGAKKLPGVLVVDRYSGYNKMPCGIQYCYSHLLREVKDLEKEFPDEEEVHIFVSTVAPLITLAIGLRAQAISEAQFRRRAASLKSEIEAAMKHPARHLGIRHIQDIFRKNKKRLYHWAKDREVPADNNLAERDLRPTVIARKVSFGSQSDAGAETRSVLMTVLHTIKKRGLDAASHLKWVLDELAKEMNQNPIPLLFPRDPPKKNLQTKTKPDMK